MIRKSTLILLLALTSLWSQSSKLLHNTLFPIQSSELSTKEKARLKQAIQKSNLNKIKKRGLRIHIKGIIDMSQKEKETDSLSYKRALSVYNYLKNELNVPSSILVIEKHDAKQFRILPITKEGQRLNRRAELNIKKPQKRIQKPVRKIVAQVISTSHSKVNSTELKKGSTLKVGDTIQVSSKGFTQILINNNYDLKFGKNSSVVLKSKSITLHKGAILLQSDSLQPPLQFATTQGTAQTRGFALIEANEKAFRISQYSGTCHISNSQRSKDISSLEGAVVFTDDTVLHTTPLPKAPILPMQDTIATVPGSSTTYSWKTVPSLKKFRIHVEDTIMQFLDTIVSNNIVPLSMPMGEYTLQIQAKDSLGFRSQWSPPCNLLVKKKSGIIDAGNLIKDDTIYVDDRFFDIALIKDSSVALTLDTFDLKKSDNLYTFRHTLHYGLNLLPVVTHYRDTSVDTTEYYIYYSGKDERFTINDSIMNKPAFTTTRKYVLQGSFPTAKRVVINGDTIKLGTKGDFKKRFSVRSYKKHPLIIDATFENGHTERFKRSITRIKGTSESEDALLKILGLAVTGGILFLVGFGIE